MKLVFPETTGALCAKMDRGLSGQDAVNGMVAVFIILSRNSSDNILRGGYRTPCKREIVKTQAT